MGEPNPAREAEGYANSISGVNIDSRAGLATCVCVFAGGAQCETLKDPLKGPSRARAR